MRHSIFPLPGIRASRIGFGAHLLQLLQTGPRKAVVLGAVRSTEGEEL